MELKFWIWLLIIAGSFIMNALKKKRQNAASAVPKNQNPQEPYQDTESGSAPMTFEDLLREIEGAKSDARPKPKWTLEKYDEKVHEQPEIEQARPVLEDTQYDYRQHDRIYEVYENAKKEAFNRPSLENTMKLANTSMDFGVFKGYEKATSHVFATEFVSELKKPSGFKKAFIMSEIIQRRF